MKEITVHELKQIQLRLLKELHDYCEKHDLHYYLTYGTLIGAIRHKGYIPWDDDIDVFMPRRDYNYLLNHFNQDVNDVMSIVSYELNTDYYLPFAKIIDNTTVMIEDVNSSFKLGVYIDVFPLDNLSDNYNDAKSIMKKAFRYNELLMLKNITVNPKRKWYKNAVLLFGRLSCGLLSRKWIISKINEQGDNQRDVFTKYVGVVTGISYGDESRVFEAKWFEERMVVPFENDKYYIPKGYDSFLRQLYGDYMVLPPKEMQESHHVFRAWYK